MKEDELKKNDVEESEMEDLIKYMVSVKQLV